MVRRRGRVCALLKVDLLQTEVSMTVAFIVDVFALKAVHIVLEIMLQRSQLGEQAK